MPATVLDRIARAAAAAVTLSFMLIVVACGDSTPSASDARKTVEAIIDRNANGRINIIEFERIDAVRITHPSNGGEYYELEYGAVIEFTEDAQVFYGDFAKNYETRTMPRNALGIGFGGRLVHANQQTQVNGTVRYVSAESGWRQDGHTVKNMGWGIDELHGALRDRVTGNTARSANIYRAIIQSSDIPEHNIEIARERLRRLTGSSNNDRRPATGRLDDAPEPSGQPKTDQSMNGSAFAAYERIMRDYFAGDEQSVWQSIYFPPDLHEAAVREQLGPYIQEAPENIASVGGVENFVLISENVGSDLAELRVRTEFGNGDSEEQSVFMRRIEGIWKWELTR